MNWFKNLSFKNNKLSELLHSFRLHERSVDLQKECFVQFLIKELSEYRTEIKRKLKDKGLACITVPDAYGFSSCIQNLIKNHNNQSQETVLYIKATEILNDANKLALIMLKEAGHKGGGHLLAQLKKVTSRNKFLIIIDQIDYLSESELKLLLDNLQNAEVILIAASKNLLKALPNVNEEDIINIPPMTDSRAIELGMALLSYRSDLILTSADRKELLLLVNCCENLPQIIYMALAGIQSEKNLAITKYVQFIKEQRLHFSSSSYYWVLAYLINQLPSEARELIKLTYYLPSSGFTAQDLYVLFHQSFASVEQISDLLRYLSHTFSLKANWINLSTEPPLGELQRPEEQLYALPEFLRKFIKSSVEDNEKAKTHECDQIKEALIQRLESNSQWKKASIWVSQLEQSFVALEWIREKKLFDSNQYTALFIQSLWIDFGLYSHVEAFFIPCCQEAINKSNTNENRGFWYSLLGITYKSIAKFKKQNEYSELALLSLSKSLKFYDPQKQAKSYSYIHQNIGSLHYELALSDSNNTTHLKLAIKSLLKALLVNENTVPMNIANIKKLVAHCHLLLGQTENHTENFQKAFNYYLQVLDLLMTNQVGEVKIQIIYSELAKLKKSISLVLERGSWNEETKLSFLEKQIERIIQKEAEQPYVSIKT